jgi:hypothetical protein
VVCCADILSAKAGACSRRERCNGPRSYPDATRFSSNGYFFFFLADFFFAFFAFLAMLPSVTPKLAQCKSTFDMHTFRVHHNCKIDTARFEEGKRPPHPRDLRPGRSPRVMRGHIERAVKNWFMHPARHDTTSDEYE